MSEFNVPKGWQLVPEEPTPQMLDEIHLVSEFTGKALTTRYRAMLSAAPAAPVAEGTTSDKYRAELYDEVWQRARDMGYGNVTDALVELERMKVAAPAVQAEQEPVAYCDERTLQTLIRGAAFSVGVEPASRRTDGNDIALYAAPPAHPDASVLVEALERARLFIRNGIDLGFIRMPDADTDDPAHETLPKIEAALSTYRAALAGKGGE